MNIPNEEKIWDIHPGITREEMAIYRASHGMEPATFNYQEDCSDVTHDTTWEAIWNEIKTWDINVPTEYNGYCGATGSHVTAIYFAIQKALKQSQEGK